MFWLVAGRRAFDGRVLARILGGAGGLGARGGGEMADEHWLDGLSRALALGVSRKRFLALAGSATLALVAPQRRASAAPARDCPQPCQPPATCCDGHCLDLTSNAASCGACGKACAAGEVCVNGACMAGDQLGPRCDPPCGAGELCLAGDSGNACCAVTLVCRGVCLSTPPQQCQVGSGGVAVTWCCPADQTCCGQGGCCAAGQTCCGDSCCEAGTTCLPNARDPGSQSPCCPAAQLCGSSDCCWGDTECINGSCWPKCGTPCPEGQICVERGAPDAGTPQTCCPADQVWDVGASSMSSRGLCCPPEHRWVAAQGSVQVPLCCPPEDQWAEQAECCPPPRRCGTNHTICCQDGEQCQDNQCQPCAQHDLNGLWSDNGHRVQISQSGASVTATYLDPWDCDHRDGTGQHSQTTEDFSGTLVCATITGQTSTCRYGAGNNPGIIQSPMQLTVSEDGNTLSGTWQSDEGSGAITLTRDQAAPVG